MRELKARKMKFSIIIPVYNVAPYLRECLDSVAAQSYTDWEAVCVDDGSTDCCGAILDEYAAKDKRFSVIHQANAGLGEARNAGLKCVSGEWLLFLDSDDVWRADLLEKINNAIADSRPFDIVRFGFDCFAEQSSPNWEGEGGDVFFPEYISFERIVDTHPLNSLVWDNAYRLSVIRDIRFKRYRPGEDQPYLAEAMVRSRGLLTIREKLYGYRGRAGSIFHTSIDLQRFLSGIASTTDEAEILANAKKPVDGIRLHWCVVMNTEFAVSNIYKLQKTDKEKAWAAWYAMLPRLRNLNAFSRYARLVLALNDVCHCHLLAIVTCLVPFWLKQHGIHR